MAEEEPKPSAELARGEAFLEAAKILELLRSHGQLAKPVSLLERSEEEHSAAVKSTKPAKELRDSEGLPADVTDTSSLTLKPCVMVRVLKRSPVREIRMPGSARGL